MWFPESMQMYEVLNSGYVYSNDLYLNMEKQTKIFQD